MNKQKFYQILGPGTLKAPPSFQMRVLRLASVSAFSLGLFFTLLLFFGWSWLASGITPTLALGTALVMTLSFGLTLYVFRLKFGLRIFGLEKGADKIFYSGFRSHSETSQSISVIILGFAWMFLALFLWIQSFPIPNRLVTANFDTRSVVTENKLPVFFWDYSLFIDPDWIMKQEVLLPYEKGPPQKLISRVLFRNRETRLLELELHGKRPRTLDGPALHSLFDEISKRPSARLHPKNYSLLYWVQFESGLLSRSDLKASRFLYERPEAVTELNLGNGIYAYGLPWTEKPDAKFFFLSPLGGIFQVHCFEPCTLGDSLASIQMPNDPKGSFKERAEFTALQIRRQLEKLQTMTKQGATAFERERQEGIVRLYLVSYVTLNPNAQEAFFHLGKLAKSSDTLNSIIRYAKDIRMEPALLAELQALANTDMRK